MNIVEQETIFETLVRFNVLPFSGVDILQKGSTTPSVKNLETWVASNTAPITITNFLFGAANQKLYIVGDNFTTIQNNTNIKTASNADELLIKGRIYSFHFINNVWIGRSDSIIATANARQFGATGLGVVSDAAAVKKALQLLPSVAILYFDPGKYIIDQDLSAEINAKECIIFKGPNTFTFRGDNVPGPLHAVLYVQGLNTYLWTKSGTINDVTTFEGLAFDGGNGAGYTGVANCPGIVYSGNAGGISYQYKFMMRKCVVTNFGYAHDNAPGSRALIDIQPVFGMIDECEFSFVPNGRLLWIGISATHTMIRRTEFTVARECYHIDASYNIVFDHVVFESCTTIGSQYFSTVRMDYMWAENIGYNPITNYTSGISRRDCGLVFGGGTLSGAGGSSGILTPFHQLYGSLIINNAQLESFALAGGVNFTAAAWFEILGVANTPSNGAYFSLSGNINGPEKLFNAPTQMTSSDRNKDVYIEVFDTWDNSGGSGGRSFFATSGNADYRHVNYGRGKISFNGGTNEVATIKRGRLNFDLIRGSDEFVAAPGPTVYPLGEQWLPGDRIDNAPPVSGGYIGMICTTGGTAGAVWKNFGLIT